MKRILALSLLVLYINSNTELHEFMRLPILFEHYSHHKQLVKDISFWDFLVMHYQTDVAHDADDNQLPFKNPAHAFTASVVAMPIVKMDLAEVSWTTNVTHAFVYIELFVASHLSDIFQPPRIF